MREALQPFIRRRKPKLVVLFGSRATGHAGPRSDTDLAVLLNRPFDPVRMTVEIGRLVGDPRLDLVDLHHAPPLLAWQIARTGELIHEGEPGAFARFHSLAFRRYCDTAKLREARERIIRDFVSGVK